MCQEGGTLPLNMPIFYLLRAYHGEEYSQFGDLRLYITGRRGAIQAGTVDRDIDTLTSWLFNRTFKRWKEKHVAYIINK